MKRIIKLLDKKISYSDFIKIIQKEYSKDELKKLLLEVENIIENTEKERNTYIENFVSSVKEKGVKPKKDEMELYISRIDKINEKINANENLRYKVKEAIKTYPLNITVSPIEDITISSVNIKTSKGNRARKERTLFKGKIYNVIREFISTGLCTHGENCFEIEDEEGYRYLVYQSDFKVI